MLVNSILFTLGIFNFGIADSVIKYQAIFFEQDKESSRQVLVSGIRFSTVLFGIVVILGWMVAEYISRFNPFDFKTARLDAIVHITKIASFTFGLKFIEQVLLASFKGILRYDLASKVSIVVKSVTVLTNVLLAYFEYPLIYIFYCSLVVSFVAVIIELFIVQKTFAHFSVSDLMSKGYSLAKLMNFGMWTWIQSSLALLTLQVDKFIVTKFFGLEVLSYYSIGYMISSQLHVLLVSLSGWIFPEVSAKVGKNESIVGIYYEMRFLLVGFGLVCVLAGYFLSDFVFKIWLGDVVYDKSSAFIKIFLLYESFLMLNIIPFHFLNGSGNERLNTSLELLSKFLNVMMMVLFFNWMGSIGLVWGLVVSMVIAVPIQAGVLYEKVLPGKRWYQGLSVFLPSIAILGLLFTDNIYVNSVLVVTAAYLFRQIYMNHAEVKKFKVLFQRSVS